MATMASSSVPAFFTLCILLCCLHTVVTVSSAAPLHLTYYAHEVHGGPNSTLLAAAGTGQGNLTEIGWGSILVADNQLKEGITDDSTLLGKVTGTVAVTTNGFAIGGPQLSAQHIFSGGSPYNGSSLTVIGTILTPFPPWEIIVPGGTKAFRGYTGYATLQPVTTNSSDSTHIVYQYDVYVSKKK